MARVSFKALFCDTYHSVLDLYPTHSKLLAYFNLQQHITQYLKILFHPRSIKIIPKYCFSPKPCLMTGDSYLETNTAIFDNLTYFLPSGSNRLTFVSSLQTTKFILVDLPINLWLEHTNGSLNQLEPKFPSRCRQNSLADSCLTCY